MLRYSLAAMSGQELTQTAGFGNLPGEENLHTAGSNPGRTATFTKALPHNRKACKPATPDGAGTAGLFGGEPTSGYRAGPLAARSRVAVPAVLRSNPAMRFLKSCQVPWRTWWSWLWLGGGWLAAVQAADSPGGAADGILAPGARVELLANGFEFTEGPAADREGNVFFTDQPNDRIMKWSVEGRLSTFLQPCGRSNGLYFDRDGHLLACADERNQLWSIAPDGRVTVLLERFEGKLLNGPNDLWIHPGGGVYFTDPLYRRNYWKRGGMEQDGQHVYLLKPDRQSCVRVASDLTQPNGIIGSPDGRGLYVADIGARKTYHYTIEPDGTLAGKRLFVEMGSDGMTLDVEGNVYLTGRGVAVFDRTGRKIQHIDIPRNWTANVTFGGRDKQTLFITASDALFAVRTRLKGI